jgi:Na+-driven multidrug efflux pump
MNNINKVGDLVFVPVITAEPISSAIATAVATSIATIINSINKGKPNPNDWQGWVSLDKKNGQPIGTNVITWIIKDGQSIENEALNILQYIRNYGTQDVLTYNSYYNRTITADDLADKLRRGGYENEAKQLIQQIQPQVPLQAANNIVDNVSRGITNVTKSTSSLLLYLGIGLGLFLILKKK